MNEPRDRVPRPPGDSSSPGSTGSKKNRDELGKQNKLGDLVPSLPEEADEVFELVDDESVTPLDVAAEAVSESLDVTPSPRKRRAPQPARAKVPADQLQAEIRDLKAKLERKDQQIEQVMEAYRGKKAETEKLRQRIEKTERRRFEQSKGDFIARFVEVLDNLDRAIDSIENAFDPDAVLQGIMLVRFRLVQLLKEEGLEKIFVTGQPFDPAHSEAAGMEGVTDQSQDGVVVKELERGYMLKGSLLRAARVIVGRFDEGGDEEARAPAAEPELRADPAPTDTAVLPDFSELEGELELLELEPDSDSDSDPDRDPQSEPEPERKRTEEPPERGASTPEGGPGAEHKPPSRTDSHVGRSNEEIDPDSDEALDFTEDGLDFASKN